MYISKPKLFIIFIIIVIVMFETIIIGNIHSENDIYSSRRNPNESYNKSSLIEEYVPKDQAVIYLKSFLNNFQINQDEAIDKYVTKNYYNDKIKDYKEQYMINLKSSLLIMDTINNHHEIIKVSVLKDENNRNIYECHIVVLQRGLEYPEGYRVLENIGSQDKLKSVKVKVLEELPYTFKIISIDITQATE